MLNFYKYTPYSNNCPQKTYPYNKTNFQPNPQMKNTPNYQYNMTRTKSKNPLPIPPPTISSSPKPAPPSPSISKPQPSPCKPPKRKNLPPKKKFNFKSLKKDTCTSLNDVEFFLNNFSSFIKYVKLINLLK